MRIGLIPKLVRRLRQGDPAGDAELIRRFVALRDERQKAAREHYDRMKKIEAAFQGTAKLSARDQAELTYYRAEAAAWLKEAETPE